MAKGMFIDLDSILDTRLPVITTLNPSYIDEVLTTTNYTYRKKDIFGSLPNDVFKAMYRERSKNVLDVATPTNILDFILGYIADLKRDLKAMVANRNYTVFINVYPYSLNITEVLTLEGLFYEMFNRYTSDISRNHIKIVSMSFDDLTPEWVEDNVESMCMYNGMEWLEFQTNNLNLIYKPLLNIILLVPAIAESRIPISDVNADFFKDLSKLFITLICLHPIPAEYFSSMMSKK